MRVSDVADAFLNLPLHPDVWPFFLTRCAAENWPPVLHMTTKTTLV